MSKCSILGKDGRHTSFLELQNEWNPARARGSTSSSVHPGVCNMHARHPGAGRGHGGYSTNRNVRRRPGLPLLTCRVAGVVDARRLREVSLPQRARGPDQVPADLSFACSVPAASSPGTARYERSAIRLCGKKPLVLEKLESTANSVIRDVKFQ